jgi:hypothetical protein
MRSLLAARRGIERTIQRIQNLFPGARRESVLRLRELTQNEFRNAAIYNRSGWDQLPQVLPMPPLVGQLANYRYHVRYSYIDPETGDTHERNARIDSSRLVTRRELRAEVFAMDQALRQIASDRMNLESPRGPASETDISVTVDLLQSRGG